MGQYGTIMDNDGQSMSQSNEPNPSLKFQKPAKKPGINRVISGNDRAIPGNDRAINYSLKY